MSRTTIRAGRDELRAGVDPGDVVKVRRAGGGRPSIAQTRPEIVPALEALVDPVTRGDPESPLRWTSKSTRQLAAELGQQGFDVSPQTVGLLLHASGYSLQATRKALEGTSHPDRNEQFEMLNARVDEFQARGAPVISVDTKKKELVGDFKNAGREWQPEGQPVPVRVHDFIDPTLGKVIPYGVYDLTRNTGWVNVGTIRPNSPSRLSRAGGAQWASVCTRTPRSCSSLPMAAAAMRPVPGCGSLSCKRLPTALASPSASPTSRPARPSGTRSSTASSATSPKTGAAAALVRAARVIVCLRRPIETRGRLGGATATG